MLMQTLFQPKVKCRYCHKTEYVKRHGKGRSGYQRYRCLECRKTFQDKYIYNVYTQSDGAEKECL